MSSALPATSARRAPENLAILLREPFRTMTDLLYRRLEAEGFGDFRVAHGAVFQYLDDDGTPVGMLAERAQITKQSMAELVAHLERTGYVERVPHPSDRRARLVLATERGREVFRVARQVTADLESDLDRRLGADRVRELRSLLGELQAALRHAEPAQ